MITSKIEQLRDPCILLENGIYYAYGSGRVFLEDGKSTIEWYCYKNTSGSLEGEWECLGNLCVTPEAAIDNHWAPEVHKYKDNFYMFTTYKSSKTGHRGCIVFKSASPEGPFVEITGGHFTPAEWDAIDATLYVDENGQPWSVFVHEWTCTEDGIGRMAAVKLSDDLSHAITEPIELFRADDPEWCGGRRVTDGCWLYRTQKGSLLMTWSNFSEEGYCVGIARSDNGKIDGKWSQEGLLFSKTINGGTYDGGHGMIFRSIEGKLYMSLHSPNNPGATRKEVPIFIPLREENDTLVWDR